MLHNPRSPDSPMSEDIEEDFSSPPADGRRSTQGIPEVRTYGIQGVDFRKGSHPGTKGEIMPWYLH